MHASLRQERERGRELSPFSNAIHVIHSFGAFMHFSRDSIFYLLLVFLYCKLVGLIFIGSGVISVVVENKNEN